MNAGAKTDDQLRRRQSRFEKFAVASGLAVVAGLAIEVWLAIEHRPQGETFVQTWGTVFSDALVAVGVFFEILFARWATHQGSELQQRAERALAEATERAGEAVARAGVLEKEAAETRLAYERLKEHLVHRSISRESANAMISVLSRGQRGSVTIEYIGGDPEALALVFALKDIIEHSGWNVGCAAQTMFGVLVFGLFVPGDSSDPLREHVRHRGYWLFDRKHSTDRRSYGRESNRKFGKNIRRL
jgi:hypothetical protein